jgi:carbon-monoxide dehydrogenase small subunit
MELVLTVNGTVWEISARPTARLIDVLRDQMGLTGTKEGCGEGECGACTVIVDGKAVNSCVMLAVQALGKEVLTVEGLAGSGELDTLQQKFVEQGAVQCGFCTPGMILMAGDLLKRNPRPTEDEIRHHIKGNICRCTGYNGIVRAIQHAAARMAGPAAADEPELVEETR